MSEEKVADRLLYPGLVGQASGPPSSGPPLPPFVADGKTDPTPRADCRPTTDEAIALRDHLATLRSLLNEQRQWYREMLEREKELKRSAWAWGDEWKKFAEEKGSENTKLRIALGLALGEIRHHSKCHGGDDWETDDKLIKAWEQLVGG